MGRKGNRQEAENESQWKALWNSRQDSAWSQAYKDSDPAVPSWTSYTKQENVLSRSIY